MIYLGKIIDNGDNTFRSYIPCPHSGAGPQECSHDWLDRRNLNVYSYGQDLLDEAMRKIKVKCSR